VVGADRRPVCFPTIVCPRFEPTGELSVFSSLVSIGVVGIHGQPWAEVSRPVRPSAGGQSPEPPARGSPRDLAIGIDAGLSISVGSSPKRLSGDPGGEHQAGRTCTADVPSLDLSGDQRAKVQELFSAMETDGIPLGEKLIAQEAELDKAFASKTITAATLAASTDAIGATHAALRQAHLKYHLLTIEVLTPTQIQRYAELRGYKGGAQHPHRQH
jgi:hypothetical protein